MEALQQKQASDPSFMVQKGEDSKDEDLSRSVVSLSELTKAFLGAAFSATLTNTCTDCKSGLIVLVCMTAIVFSAPN